PAAGRTFHFHACRAFPTTPSSDLKTSRSHDHISDLVGLSFQQQPLGQMAQWSTSTV
ncbi:hypothetical protein QBC45DRAFT_330795, partial [Copromyces sp. CBS 386.78]